MRNKNWIEFNNNVINKKEIEDKVFTSQSIKLKIYKEKYSNKNNNNSEITRNNVRIS